MSWEAWVIVVTCVTSAAASPMIVGEVRTKGQMAWNAATLLFFVWLTLRIEGVL